MTGQNKPEINCNSAYRSTWPKHLCHFLSPFLIAVTPLFVTTFFVTQPNSRI